MPPGKLRHYLELIRFSHTIFALPFAALAAAMAWKQTSLDAKSEDATLAAAAQTSLFSWRQVLGVLLCMVAARSAAMAFNRVVDARYDAQNPRTERRHIPTGLLSPLGVSLFALAMSGLFVAATLLFLPNPWPVRLAVPVILFLLGYSYAKRFTSLAHVWLGVALMLAPICTWIALRGNIVAMRPDDLLPALLLGIGVMFWVSGFDIIYACQDHDFDRQQGLFSLPVKFGPKNALRIAAGLHVCMLLSLLALPYAFPHFGVIYYLGLAAAAVLIFVEHRLVRPDDLTRVNAAFFVVNGIISIGLLLIGVLDTWIW
jgi:4-hydroxybenzoate polyprenyltransferase